MTLILLAIRGGVMLCIVAYAADAGLLLSGFAGIATAFLSVGLGLLLLAFVKHPALGSSRWRSSPSQPSQPSLRAMPSCSA